VTDLSSLDRSLFLFLNSLHAEWLNPLMVVLSGQIVWAPFILFFLWISWKKEGKHYTGYFVLFLVLTLIASDVTSSYIFKNLFNRLRPCRLQDLKPLIYHFGQKCGGKYGFVSSHSANSFGLFLYSINTLGFERKWVHGLWIFPSIVAYSRIYLGVHYPGDILGGVLIGLCWGWFFANCLKKTQGASLDRSQQSLVNS
jgi:undecaprenyl-diphosphatase